MNTTTQPLRVVIVGGVAAGASCAARLRRLSESAHITLIERGPDVSFANCGLPYYIGGEITDRSRLALQTPVSLSQLLSLSVCVNTEAVHIDRERKKIVIRHLQTLNEELLPYDKLVLTPGASVPSKS
jgi:NADPH-dependent 2,4-dienoyl-CoA reductase/sulfur reductase-like enzyme